MKLRKQLPVVCVLISIALPLLVGTAAAQDLYQPLFTPPPPYGPSLSAGRFYVNLGVRIRKPDTFRIDVAGGPVRYGTDGRPAFGPLIAGNFGQGTGQDGYPNNPTRDYNSDPNASGVWIYHDGLIDPNQYLYPGGFACTYSDDSVDPAVDRTIDCGDLRLFWSMPYVTALPPEISLLMGRHVSGDNVECCADNSPYPWNVGRFLVDDPDHQANSSNFSTTTALTYERMIDGNYNTAGYLSRVIPVFNEELQIWLPTSVQFDFTPTSLEVPSRIIKGWRPEMGHKDFDITSAGPMFEVGFQALDFFDMFYSLGWYSHKEKLNRSLTFTSPIYRRGFRDTFPFFSSHDVNWADQFDSSATNINGEPAQNYHLYVDNMGRGFFPFREFFERIDMGLTNESIRETIQHKAEISFLDHRFGGRSWVPIYGYGKFGAYAGGSLIQTHYDLRASSTAVSLGPNFPGETIGTQVANRKFWTTTVGWFAGADLEFAFDRYTVTGSFDYTYARPESYGLLSVNTTFNPGGMSFGLTGGMRF